MSKKSPYIAALIRNLHDPTLDPHYLGFFECFNQQLFYEAHDVLEELWLPTRGTSVDRFYKGLIQLAGAFVHLQKNRLKPAGSLFQLARNNLERYLPAHQQLEIAPVLGLIRHWHGCLESTQFSTNPLTTNAPPKLTLIRRQPS